MVNFGGFFEQQFFSRLLQVLLVFGFADVAGVDDGVDNGPDAVALVGGFDFLLSESFGDLVG